MPLQQLVPNTIPTVPQQLIKRENMLEETVRKMEVSVEETTDAIEEESLIEIEGVSVETSDDLEPSNDTDTFALHPLDDESSTEMKSVAGDSGEEMNTEWIDETEDVSEESLNEIAAVPDDTVQEIGTVTGLTTHEVSTNIGKNVLPNLHWCNPCQRLFSDTEIKPHQLSHFNGRLVECARCIEGFTTERLVQEHVLTHMGLHINTQQRQGLNVKAKSERRVWARSSKHPVSRLVGLNMNTNKHGGSTVSTSKNQITDILNKSTQRVSCRLCRASFKSQPDVLKHSQIHFTETPYKCRLCQKYFNTQDVLTHHEALLCDKTIHECGTCGKVFKKREQLMYHQLVHPPQVKHHKGKDSGPIPPTKVAESSHFNHMRTPSQKQGANLNSPKCKLCGEGFESWKEVASHLHVHNEKTQYRCSRCEKYFRTQDELTEHETKLCIRVNAIKCG